MHKNYTKHNSFLLIFLSIVPPQLWVDYATMLGALLAFIVSSYLNVRDWVARKKEAAIETFIHSK